MIYDMFERKTLVSFETTASVTIDSPSNALAHQNERPHPQTDPPRNHSHFYPRPLEPLSATPRIAIEQGPIGLDWASWLEEIAKRPLV